MRSVDPVTIARLIAACRKGIPVEQVARSLGISESTATKAIRDHRMAGHSLNVARGRPSAARLRQVPRRLPRADTTPEGVRSFLAWLLKEPFPYPPPLSPLEVFREIHRLRSIDVTREIPRDPVGTRLCAPFFPNRYAARYRSSVSAVDAWQDAQELRAAILFQVRHGDPVTPHRVLRAVTLRCRTPTIFRPAVAHFLCARYCSRGGIMWDPCAGYGGRLLGAHSAGVRYVGTDVDPATVEGNLRLSTEIGADAEVHLTPAESFDPPPVDLVLTSPPYFNRERYSTGTTQSSLRYPSLDAWCDGFLYPLMTRAREALRHGGHLVLNVADLRERRRTVPLVDRTLAIGVGVGLAHVATLRMPIARVNRKTDSEPVLVFKKV